MTRFNPEVWPRAERTSVTGASRTTTVDRRCSKQFWTSSTTGRQSLMATTYTQIRYLHGFTSDHRTTAIELRCSQIIGLNNSQAWSQPTVHERQPHFRNGGPGGTGGFTPVRWEPIPLLPPPSIISCPLLSLLFLSLFLHPPGRKAATPACMQLWGTVLV